MCWEKDPHQQQPLKASLGLALSAQVVRLICGKFSKIYLSSWVIIREHPNFFCDQLAKFGH